MKEQVEKLLHRAFSQSELQKLMSFPEFREQLKDCCETLSHFEILCELGDHLLNSTPPPSKHLKTKATGNIAFTLRCALNPRQGSGQLQHAEKAIVGGD